VHLLLGAAGWPYGGPSASDTYAFCHPERSGAKSKDLFCEGSRARRSPAAARDDRLTTPKSSPNPGIARVVCNARPKGRDVAAVPPQTGSATFVSLNMQFDDTSRAPAQGLGSIGAVPEPLIAGVVADSCNKRAKRSALGCTLFIQPINTASHSSALQTTSSRHGDDSAGGWSYATPCGC